MFDKKRALICMIILYALGAVSLIVFLVGSVILNVLPPKLNTFLPILFIMPFLAAAAMTVVYARLKKRERTANKNAATTKADDETYWKEFNEWLTAFEPLTKAGAILTETTDGKFSKFGGLPLVPPKFVWPSFKNKPIPFLLQIDFSEINADKSLKDFPEDGLAYVFVDGDKVNFADVPVDGDYSYTGGETFKILFFEKSDRLTQAAKPDLLETVYKEFFVSAETVNTYPDVDDCEEAFDIYCNRPYGGMDDAYDELQWQNMESSMLGGWASYVQSGGFMKSLKEGDEEWVLLMQIASSHDDGKMTWGDCGVLYFYIRTDDLRARNFSGVRLDMQCT